MIVQGTSSTIQAPTAEVPTETLAPLLSGPSDRASGGECVTDDVRDRDLDALPTAGDVASGGHSRPHGQGNTEGTPAGEQTGTLGHSSSGDSSFLRGFRARGFPRLPALPGLSLDGKAAVPGSSPGEGLNTCKSAISEDYGVPLDQGGA
jgi:hypothetical protein